MPTTGSQRAQFEDLLLEYKRERSTPNAKQAIEKAVALSQEMGDEELEYRARYYLIDMTEMSGDTDALVTSFTWCLARHDVDPVRFPSRVEPGWSGLMWMFKWVVNSLNKSPIFSLAQCEAALDDMEEHYRREDLGMSAVLRSRFYHAWSTGQLEEASRLFTALRSTPRDRYSDCEVCCWSEDAGFALEIGDDAQALEILDKIITSNRSCTTEPEQALARTLIANLRAGRLEEARDAHIRSYRMARNNPVDTSAIANNLVFCAVTCNEARGLAMLERHLSWLGHNTLNEEGRRDMLTAIGVVLESVIRVGHGDQLVRGANSAALTRFFGQHDEPWTVEELAPVVCATTDQLADAFDKRNGNTYISSQVASTRALIDEHFDLPLNMEVFVPPTPTAHVPETSREKLELADILFSADQFDDAIEICEQLIDDEDTYVRSQSLATLMAALLSKEDRQAVAELLPRRIEALRLEGADDYADVMERLGFVLFDPESPDDMEMLENERVRLTAESSPELARVECAIALAQMQHPEMYADSAENTENLLNCALSHSSAMPNAAEQSHLRFKIFSILALFHANNGDPEGAVPNVVEALELIDSCGDRAPCLNLRAQIMGMIGRYDEGAASADEAATIYASGGATQGVIDSSMLAARLFEDAERYDDMVVRLRYALREAQWGELPDRDIRFQLGRALTFAGHPQEAVEQLWSVLTEQEETDAGAQARAETASILAWAMRQARELGSTVYMLQKAASYWKEADQPLNAANMLRQKGDIFSRIGRHDQALDACAEAWELVNGQDDRSKDVLFLEALALAKAGSEDQTAVDDIERCLSLVRDDPQMYGGWRVPDLMHTKGRVLARLTRYDEADGVFVATSAAYQDMGCLAEAAQTEHLAAQFLAGPLERAEDAVTRFQSALSLVDRAIAEGVDANNMRASILVKLAESLDAVGQGAEAANVREKIG